MQGTKTLHRIQPPPDRLAQRIEGVRARMGDALLALGTGGDRAYHVGAAMASVDLALDEITRLENDFSDVRRRVSLALLSAAARRIFDKDDDFGKDLARDVRRYLGEHLPMTKDYLSLEAEIMPGYVCREHRIAFDDLFVLYDAESYMEEEPIVFDEHGEQIEREDVDDHVREIIHRSVLERFARPKTREWFEERAAVNHPETC